MRKLTIACTILFVLLFTTSGNCFRHCTAAPLREPLMHFRIVSGYVLTQQNERLPGVTVIVTGFAWDARTISDREGYFRLEVPVGSITIRVEGKNVQPLEKAIGRSELTENLEFKVNVVIAPIQESVVIQDTTLNPTIDQRNDTIYRNTLLERDDQLVESLNAGINAGQHEGGGKSLEIRRFGYNLDHGGVNGGLKVLVDDVQQNHGSQGHGQGYLGQLKSLTPELIDDVDILNGPFSAHYGDFSGLGVVHIHLKESLPDQLTLRLQGGNFNSKRVFVAYSPVIKDVDSFFAYEGAYTDGPFLNPGRYRRDNFTGNFTRRLDRQQSISFKLNIGRNDFFSSGQIPLNEVNAGTLDRFGFIDPFNGGRARTGIFSAYYKKDMASGAMFKVDGFLGRSLFDLFSNFTFFLNDPVFGDEIQQHDSRLQEGVNLQFLQPHKLFGKQSLLTVGGNLHANQIQIGLFPSIERNPNRLALNQAAGIDNFGVANERACKRDQLRELRAGSSRSLKWSITSRGRAAMGLFSLQRAKWQQRNPNYSGALCRCARCSSLPTKGVSRIHSFGSRTADVLCQLRSRHQ